jgi:hypothetical protein
MYLQRIGEHDKNNNSSLSNGGSNGWNIWSGFSIVNLAKRDKVVILTHANNITGDIITKGKISSNSNQNVNRAGRTNTGANDSRSSTEGFRRTPRGSIFR